MMKMMMEHKGDKFTCMFASDCIPQCYVTEMQNCYMVEVLGHLIKLLGPTKSLTETPFAFQVSVSGHGCYRRQREEEERRQNVWFPGERP